MRKRSSGGNARGSTPGLGLILVAGITFAIVVVLFPPSRFRTLVALLLPLVVLIVVSIRWLRHEATTKRLKATGLGATSVAALVLGFGTTFPVPAVALLWGLPASLLSALVAASLWRRHAARPYAVGAIFLASLVPWLLLRGDGVSGEMMPNLFWKWDSRARAVSGSTEVRDGGAVEVPNVATSRDWPGFRGAKRQGIAPPEAVAEIGLDWELEPPMELWRRAIGKGWSSFAVVGALACTQDQVSEMERIVCLDARTGEGVWVHEREARFEEPASGAGPRATPSIHDGRLYALSATGRLDCLEAGNGELLWVDLSKGAEAAPTWGFASSPLIRGDLVYVSPAGIGGTRMLALDRRTGETVWESTGEEPGYSSPRLVEIDGTPQLLLFDGGGLVGYEPRTGETLWEYDWPTPLPRAALPALAGSDLVVVGMGYGQGTRSLRPENGARGWSVTEEWSTSRLKPSFNDFVVHRDHLFGLDEGILVCLDALTGERLWKGGRYGHGQLLLVGEVLLIVSESGDLVLVEASPTGHRELARVPALTGKTWNHPAIAGGRLFVRNGSEAVSYRLGEP